MIVSNQIDSLSQFRQTDMVDYLSSLGHEPKRVRNFNYWYLSPLRDERTPSFKINRKINCWYDHGIGKGGDIIDFAVLYYHCSPVDLLKSIPSFTSQKHSSTFPDVTKVASPLRIIGNRVITSLVLIRYLHKRHIPLSLAHRHCREIAYQVYGRNYFALGFKNDSGGFELRNEFFKGSTSPKDLTTINHRRNTVAVFEGFFDFLSMMAITPGWKMNQMDICILNSLSFYEKATPFLEDHEFIHLFLDHDQAGTAICQRVLKESNKYTDESHLYQNYKDLNDWLVNMGKGHHETKVSS